MESGNPRKLDGNGLQTHLSGAHQTVQTGMSVAPEEFKRQENKQAFWSQRAHSLSHPQAHSFFLSSVSPSPPPPNLLLGRFCSAIFMAVCSFFRPSPSISSRNVCFWKKKDNKSWLDEPGGHSGTDGQAVQAPLAQGLLYFTGTGTWHGKFPHHSTELDQGLQHKASPNPPPPPPLPAKIFCHAHASCLISNKRAFVRVFFLCMRV